MNMIGNVIDYLKLDSNRQCDGEIKHKLKSLQSYIDAVFLVDWHCQYQSCVAVAEGKTILYYG